MMNLLLDTHTFLWAIDDAPQLSAAARSAITGGKAVENLPHHHKDPFDRLLIAQAQIKKLTLVTHDPQIKAYDVSIIET